MENFAERLAISEHLRVYGSLLSKRQQEFAQLYYDQNLSLAEIAQEFTVSRQAVHDTIKQGRRRLLHFEAVLGLLSEPGRQENIIELWNEVWRVLGAVEAVVVQKVPGTSNDMPDEMVRLRDLLEKLHSHTNPGDATHSLAKESHV